MTATGYLDVLMPYSDFLEQSNLCSNNFMKRIYIKDIFIKTLRAKDYNILFKRTYKISIYNN